MNSKTHELGVLLLEYIRKETDNPSITYNTPLTPMKVGRATQLYAFQLENTPDHLSQKLILRLFPSHYPRGQAEFEGVIQTILSNLKYPAPRVFFTCTDLTVLGNEFIIMKFMPGTMMTTTYPIHELPRRLAQAHLNLHSIDAIQLKKELEQRGFYETEKGLFKKDLNAFINFLEHQTQQQNASWLIPGVQWIKEHQPQMFGKIVICHGDFHPNNILISDGTISAVLDWSGCRIWEPAFDITNTKIKLSCVAPDIFKGAEHLTERDWLHFVNTYYKEYFKDMPLDQERVQYYEAVWCMQLLVLLGMGFRVIGLPGVKERLFARFNEITGIELIYQ